MKPVLEALVGRRSFFRSAGLAAGAGALGLATRRDAEERLAVSALLARIPAEATVSAHYRFLPHLARRPQLYMFPTLGPAPPDVVLVDLDRAEADADEQAVLARLRAGCRELARTARRTVLLACPAEGSRGVTPPRRGDSTSPPGHP